MSAYSETEVRVIFGDTDAMGIVYYGNYLRWFEVGRNEFMRQMNYPYARMEREGNWLPVVEVSCKYKAPARYDDLLLIRTHIKEIKASTIVMGYEIVKKDKEEICVTGWTRHAVTDASLKPINFKKQNPALYKRVKETIK